MNTQDKAIQEIAKRVLHIQTLEKQNLDSLDFHDVAVWQIQKALKEAFEQGAMFAKGEI